MGAKADLIHNVLFMFSTMRQAVQPFPAECLDSTAVCFDLDQIQAPTGRAVISFGTRSKGGDFLENESKGQRYPLPCPVCKTAMIGEKSDPAADYDRFTCLRCGAVVVRESSTPDDSTA